MILYPEDISRHNAIIDLETHNESFIKMAMILNKMGIKNNLFFLALTQPELRGIDPHNLKDNSIELKQRIAIECKVNYWYCLREVIRVTGAGAGGIPYILNRANLAQSWLLLQCIDTFLTIPRQCGKSIGTMTLFCYYMYLLATNCNIGEFCKGFQLLQDNVDRLKKIRDALPPWMINQSMNDINNKEGIGYAALNNKLLTFVAQSDKAAAGDQARGSSLSLIHVDEICYYNNIWLSYDSFMSCMTAAGEQAINVGIPSAVMCTSTAGDIDDPRGKYAYRMVCDAIRFSEKMYDIASRDELFKILRLNSKNRMVYLEFSHSQLGKNQEWFDKNTRGKDPKVIEKDYLNRWQHGASGSIFQKELIDKMQASRREPLTCTFFESLMIRWYDDPVKLMTVPEYNRRPYVIALDTSDNAGRDFTTMCMLDPYDLHTTCTFRSNSVNLIFVARAVIKFMKDFPRSILIPERNKNGAMLLDYVFAEMKRESFNPLTRIYNKFFQEYTSNTDVRNLDYNSGLIRAKFGFHTGANSREFLYTSVMTTALNLNADRMYDSTIIDEACGLTVKNGRVDHSDAGHDDSFIGYLLANYFILFGSNHQLYGIEPDEFMRNVEANGDIVAAEEKQKKTLMKNQLVELKSKAGRCNNVIVKAAYEREITRLTELLGNEVIDSSIKPLDQLENAAAKEVRANRSYSMAQLARVL